MSPVRILFDGGCEPINPGGNGHGSFCLLDDPTEIHRFNFSQSPEMTNNIAEFRTAIEALRWLAVELEPSQTIVELTGDSMLAINCLSGRWKTKKPHLKLLRDEFQSLAAQFFAVELVWHRRTLAVELLGH